MSLQAVSKHLKVLEHAGLISRGRNAQYRPCRLEAAPLDTRHRLDRAAPPASGTTASTGSSNTSENIQRTQRQDEDHDR